MVIQITVEAKKAFISWFLDRYQLKRRESMWILNYLLNHDIVLNKVHFVEHVSKTPRGIKMSTVGVESEPFLFYKDGKVFTDPEQAFHEVRLNWRDDMYLELSFRDPWKTEQYLAVLEDNPYHKWNDQISSEVIYEVDDAMRKLDLINQKNQLLTDIDQALELGDKLQFINLSSKLNYIEKELAKNQKKTNS